MPTKTRRGPVIEDGRRQKGSSALHILLAVNERCLNPIHQTIGEGKQIFLGVWSTLMELVEWSNKQRAAS